MSSTAAALLEVMICRSQQVRVSWLYIAKVLHVAKVVYMAKVVSGELSMSSGAILGNSVSDVLTVNSNALYDKVFCEYTYSHVLICT